MEIKRNYLTKNKCYIKGTKLNPKGIMLHSTACPGVMAKNFLTSWNVYQPNGKSVCVHGFLDNTGFYQTLPWNIASWHCAGSLNYSYIGFEICEPKNYADKQYFETVKNTAIEVCVYLMKEFNIPVENITTHCEAHKKNSAYASNHGDIDHWWKKYHNYTMDNFRADVKKKLNESEEEEMVYNYIDKNMPDWARPTIQKLVDKGYLKGNENGELGLNDTMLKVFVINDRAGVYGE